MKISNEQVRHILTRTREELREQRKADVAVIRLTDQDLIRKVTRDVLAMDDRVDFIREVRERVETGNYSVSGDEIADAMVRRAIADSLPE